MRSLLLDSVILFDVLRDVPDAVAYVREAQDDALISATTRAEVLARLDEDGRSQVSAFLEAFPCLPLTRAVADRGAHLSRDRNWPLPAALQVALALENSLTLATRPTGDFDPSAYDFATVPYTVNE